MTAEGLDDPKHIGREFRILEILDHEQGGKEEHGHNAHREIPLYAGAIKSEERASARISERSRGF